MIFFKKSEGSAFTLIEVALAMAILLIGVVGIASLVPVSLSAIARSKNVATVAMLAESKVEDIKKDAFLSGANWEALESVTAYTPFPSPHDNFKWKTDVIVPVAEGTSLPVVGLKQVRLTIKWTERGSDRTEQFETYIAKR